jgi:signal transduction histidine kinase
VGVLALGAAYVSESDKPVVTAFANQMTVAWHRARIMLELQRRLRELRQTQEQLVRAEKLAAIGQLVSGVAHELNNPLTAIGGLSELAEAAATDEQTRADLHRIHEQALRAAKIVQSLLFFARKREPKREPVDLNALLRHTVELQSGELRSAQVQVQYDLADDLPALHADPFQLQQVFVNLVANARQALLSCNGGHLVIATHASHAGACRSTGLSMGDAPPAEPSLDLLETPGDVGLGRDEAQYADWSPGLANAPESPGLSMGDAPPVEASWTVSEYGQPEPSAVYLASAPSDLGEALTGSKLCIEFRDDGPGILPEVMSKIFDPFFTTKKPGIGTGLGLSICYGIVQAHQGRIWAESEPGQGATFVIELPVDVGEGGAEHAI